MLARVVAMLTRLLIASIQTVALLIPPFGTPSSFVLGRFPVVRAKLPLPCFLPSSFYPTSILAIGPNP